MDVGRRTLMAHQRVPRRRDNFGYADKTAGCRRTTHTRRWAKTTDIDIDRGITPPTFPCTLSLDGPPPPSRLLLALTLFFTLTHATVTAYTPTQVVITAAPSQVSGASYTDTGIAAYNAGTLSPPPSSQTPSPSTSKTAVLAMGEILNGRVLLKNLTGITGTTQTPPLPTCIGFWGFLGRAGVRGNETRRPRLAWGLLVVLLRRGSGFIHAAIFLYYLARMPRRPLGRKIKGKSTSPPITYTIARTHAVLSNQTPHAIAPSYPHHARRAESGRALVHTAAHAHTPAPSTRACRYRLGLPWTCVSAHVMRASGLVPCMRCTEYLQSPPTYLNPPLPPIPPLPPLRPPPSSLLFSESRGRLTRTKSSPDACDAVGGIHTYNLRWEGGKFDVEYRGVERGYYGLKNTSNGRLALVVMEFEKPWLKS
ncbi:hypothetical protein B0H16DRAFT_1706182 [Mycena metata]|uniref:Uncharacterized protein n=1 Tax=Mycena metata TaxID=1033252 RepID=A0AAD7DTR5_9AGAR|nr:hypothetical protein B0H16DRAFT_1706182 [Mycena metata]